MNPFGQFTAQQFRLAYELLPRIPGTGRAKTTLDLLVLDPNVDENSLALLGRIQWLNWHLAEIPECAEMNVHVHVPEDYSTVREFFDALGLEYWIHEPVDAASPMAVRAAVVSSDCDAVLARDPAHLKKQIEPGLCIVTDQVEQILETVDIYARGFDVPWSSRGPHKNQPWTAFYLMSDIRSQSEPFASLLGYESAFETASPAAREALRVMIYNTIPNLCYGRDRLLFYQMQIRAAERAAYERQHFEFEAAYHLNHFYLSLYSAIDQVAIMVNAFLNLGLSEREIGATYSQFREPLKRRSSVVHGLFTNAEFKDLSERVNLLRHQAAHRRPLMPTRIVSEPDHQMSDAELDEKIEEYGWSLDLPEGLVSDEIQKFIVETLREKARLAAMETVAEQVVVVLDGKTPTHIVSPDARGDVEKFLRLLDRVLKEMPARTPTAMVAHSPGAPVKDQPQRRRRNRQRR